MTSASSDPRPAQRRIVSAQTQTIRDKTVLCMSA